MQLQAEYTRNMMRRKKKERHLKGETKRVNWSKENETELGLAVNIKDQNGSQGSILTARGQHDNLKQKTQK
jgi:hypothetical protein